MEIKDYLLKRKSRILKVWFDGILESYPSETAAFLKSQKNRFSNPVGQTIKEGLEGVLDGILGESSDDEIAPYLDRIIRVRAVQDFAPSEAVSFIFLLKKVIRDEFQEDLKEGGHYEELLSLDLHIDRLAGRAFDIFMQCREKLYELKANEMRNWTYRLVEQANKRMKGAE